MKLTLKIWRQLNAKESGKMVEHQRGDGKARRQAHHARLHHQGECRSAEEIPRLQCLA